MQTTFLVKVEIMDVTEIPGVAEDIEDDLLSAGHDVISVEPWARPATLGIESNSVFGEGAEQPPPLF